MVLGWPLEAPGALWASPGASWDAPGAPWGAPWASLGASWGTLGSPEASGDAPGAPWGAPCAASGRSKIDQKFDPKLDSKIGRIATEKNCPNTTPVMVSEVEQR